ncbi:MAG TPA: hypothetical protein VMX33_06410 [bacterium]|nr:hypothetical protein [bacterium]
MMTRRCGGLLLAALLASLVSVSAQDAPPPDNVDSLFDTPPTDTVVVDSGIDYRSLYDTEEKIKTSGYFKAMGGAAVGYVRWPTLDDLGNGFASSIGAYAEAVAAFDMRPSSVAHIRGEFSTSFTPATSPFSWDNFAVDELYCDYTVQDTVFVRIGQFLSTWGQGRLFTPGDLLSDSADGFSMRLSMPTVLNGISAYAFGSGHVESYGDLSYAAKTDAIVLDTFLSAALRYRYADGYKGLVSIKKVAWKTDLFIDMTGNYQQDLGYYEGVAGFFREWDDLKLYGEYYLKGDEHGLTDQQFGVAIGQKNIAGTPIDVGIRWLHSIADGSGTVLAALSWNPWKYVTASIGLPYMYGTIGSYYGLISAVTNDEDIQVQSLDGYRFGLIGSLLLKVPF